MLGQTARDSDWLIGAELFGPGVNGKAVRSKAAPGTAYDDPILGRDPQPSHMRNYIDTPDDNGGVHIKSGILNHAFYLAAVAAFPRLNGLGEDVDEGTDSLGGELSLSWSVVPRRRGHRLRSARPSASGCEVG